MRKSLQQIELNDFIEDAWGNFHKVTGFDDETLKTYVYHGTGKAGPGELIIDEYPDGYDVATVAEVEQMFKRREELGQ